MDRKKVLIVSYLWPPMEGVGLLRAFKFAKYLPVFGWDPVILTVKADDTREPNPLPEGPVVHRTGYRDVIGDLRRRLHVHAGPRCINNGPALRRDAVAGGIEKPSLIRELVAMPDEQIGWRRFGVAEGEKIIAEDRVDVIFSTSPPETAHLIARRLKRQSGIPWVADLRDLWADDHFRPRPLFKKMALRLLERRVLSDADAIVTVSEPWAKTIRSSVSKRVEVVENGYDEEDFTLKGCVPNKKFTISYTGKLHKRNQPINVFFDVLRSLVRDGRIDRNKIEVRFYVLGYDKPDIKEMARTWGLEGVVTELGRIGYRESLEAQSSSDALLFVQWRGAGCEGWYSAKLYDYIGSRRPILALAERGGIIDDIIGKTSSGMIADNADSLKEALTKLYDGFIKEGRCGYGGKEDEIVRLTRKGRAEELSGLFNSIIERGR